MWKSKGVQSFRPIHHFSHGFSSFAHCLVFKLNISATGLRLRKCLSSITHANIQSELNRRGEDGGWTENISADFFHFSITYTISANRRHLIRSTIFSTLRIRIGTCKLTKLMRYLPQVFIWVMRENFVTRDENKEEPVFFFNTCDSKYSRFKKKKLEKTIIYFFSMVFVLHNCIPANSPSLAFD